MVPPYRTVAQSIRNGGSVSSDHRLTQAEVSKQSCWEPVTPQDVTACDEPVTRWPSASPQFVLPVKGSGQTVFPLLRILRYFRSCGSVSSMTVAHQNNEPRHIVQPRVRRSLAHLKVFLSRHRGHTVLTAPDGATTELPDEVYEVIAKAVTVMADGSAVAVAPVSSRLSTSQAAEVLGVSRPTLVKMLDDGKIPFEQLNVHRTLSFADVLAFKERRRTETRAILDEMTRQAAADGLYDESYEEYAEALQNARHHQVR